MQKIIIVLLVIIIIYFIITSTQTNKSKFDPAPVLPQYNINGSQYLEFDREGAFNAGNQAKVYYST